MATQAERMMAILMQAVDADGGVRYYHQEDEIGFRCCCGVVEYESHAADCWVLAAKAEIARGVE